MSLSIFGRIRLVKYTDSPPSLQVDLQCHETIHLDFFENKLYRARLSPNRFLHRTIHTEFVWYKKRFGSSPSSQWHNRKRWCPGLMIYSRRIQTISLRGPRESRTFIVFTEDVGNFRFYMFWTVLKF